MARSHYVHFQIFTLVSPIPQISLKQVIDCNQGSECFCADADSSLCHKLFITKQGKQAVKNICFYQRFFNEGLFQFEKAPGKVKLHSHVNHVLLPQKLYH